MNLRVRHVVLGLFLLVAASRLGAQTSTLIVSGLHGEDGLAGSAVLTVAADAAGRVLLGTDAGLSRLDSRGLAAVDLGIDTPLVSALLEQPEGVLWIGYNGGLGRLVEERYEPVPLPAASNVSAGRNRVAALLADGRDVLVGSHLGLYRVDPQGRASRVDFDVDIEDQAAASLVFCLLRTRSLGILVGTADGTYRLRDGAPPEFLFRLAARERPWDERATRGMFELDDGRILVGGHKESRLFDPETMALGPLPVAPAAPGRLLPSLSFARGREGRIWACSPWSGLWAWTPATGRIERFRLLPRNQSRSEAEPFVFSVHGTADGLVWFCSPDGLYYFFEDSRLPRVEFPTDENGDGRGRVHDIVPDGAGGLWLAAGGDGLQRRDRDGRTRVHVIPGLAADDPIHALDVAADGRVYGGTGSREVFLCPAGDEAPRRIPEPMPSGRRPLAFLLRREGAYAAADEQGLLLVAADGSIETLDYRGTPFTGAYEVLPRGIRESRRGELWILTKTGLFRRDLSGSFHRYSLSDDGHVDVVLPADALAAWRELPDGRLLLSAGGALYLLDHEAGSCAPLAVTEPTGRRVGFLHEFRGRPDGTILALTSSSVLSIRLDSLLARELPVALPSSNLILARLHEGDEGRLFLSCGEGFIELHPEEEGTDRGPPPPRLTELEILGSPAAIPGPGRVLELPEDRNSLRLVVTANDIRNRERLRYSVRMQGADPNWQILDREGVIHYGGLGPGRYRFEAMADNGSGAWSDPVTVLEFELVPPFWKRAPFQIGAALVVGLALLAGFRRRVGIERRRAEVLEEVVAARTEDLRTKSNELERLYSVVRNINVATTLEDLLDLTLVETIAALGADGGRFYLREKGDWRLAVVAGWRRREGYAVPPRLAERLAEASPRRAIAPIEETATDVSDAEGSPPRCASLAMMLHDQREVEACMVIDATGAIGPAEREERLRLFERLYQPVTLAYRKLRLLERAEALNERKNEILGTAAHDLRSPLTVIGMTAETLGLEVKALASDHREAATREVDLIARATRRMAAMVDKLLDISAIESGRVQIDLADSDMGMVARERVEFFAKLAASRGIALEFEEPAGTLPVRIDAERIGTALDNLVGNALKYTPGGGRVVVGCSRRDGDVLVEVRDDGPGLPPEDAADLFERFRRMSARPQHGEVASGLGLAIVKRIVELHGGRVHARSKQGEGSTFGFVLPGRRAGAPSAPVT